VRERARLEQLRDDARSGAGGALVVLGEPGAGKSVLLEHLLGETEDMTVLRTQGIESEAPLAFAALQRLLRPLLPLVGQLPAPQAHALRVALGEEVGEASDRFLVFLGVLSLLAEAAETRPVVAVVDDAHWLDDASAAALLFVARRLQVERVALVFAARTDDVRTFDVGDLETLSLTGLDLAAGTELLRDHTGVEVTAEVAAQLLASTGGNPLALVELPRALTTEQLAGGASLPGRLPVTGTVERVFLDRARRLPPETQRLLLVAAADDSARVATVVAAAATLGVGPEALAPAEESGLVRVAAGALELRHPLVRSAVYTAATSADRQRAHAALADAMTGVDDADRRAWHRAASVDRPTPEVVSELEAAARRAEGRGGHEAASAAWERAAELSDDPAERARRVFAAACGAWLAGQPGRARRLAETAHRGADDPLLVADVVQLRARIEWNTGSVALGHQMVLEGAREVAPYDAARALQLAVFAAALAGFGGGASTIDPAEFAVVPEDAPLRQRAQAELVLGLCDAVRGEWKGAAAMLRRAFATGEQAQVDDHDLLPNLAVGAMHLGDAPTLDAYHQRMLTRARRTGAAVIVLYALTRLGISDLVEGRWSALAARQSEALRLGEGTGHRVLAAMPEAWLLLLAAFRGDAAYESLLPEVEASVDAQAAGTLDVLLRDVARWAKGAHAGTRTPAAFHQLAQMTHPTMQRAAGIDRVEAAVHADQRETARLWVADLEAFAADTEQAWPAAAAAHGQALLADESREADELFERALGFHAESGRPFDRARTQLAYGEHLRRTRRRVDAREHLRAALEVFEDLRAAPWADRAAAELRASGETARKRDEAAPVGLTPTELQVAQLVQRGMSNREVAGQLFVSPRTVDFHLRNVFTKTGVTSRLELAQLTLT
jgi:DNA-binding CsgD family transcriptional regulator